MFRYEEETRLLKTCSAQQECNDELFAPPLRDLSVQACDGFLNNNGNRKVVLCVCVSPSACAPAFSCKAGEFLEMSAQQCTQCAAGSYSLGSGVRFDQWDSMPAGFSSLATSLESGPRGDGGLSCNRSASGDAGKGGNRDL